MDLDSKYATLWKEGGPNTGNIRQQLRTFTRSAVLSLLSFYAPERKGVFLRCLFCHYVFDDQVTKFITILKALKRIGTFVDTTTCVEMLKGNIEIDGRYFHLSFDDGLRNIFLNAMPVLITNKIPATFFVPTGLVGADYQRTQQYCLNTTHYRGVIEMVDWDDLKKMKDHGFEIGSHTRNHKKLSEISISPNVLSDEILGSKQDIEKYLGTECRYMSWPYGKKTDIDDISMKLAYKMGYEAVFGAFRGTVIPGKTNHSSIPRHHFEVEWPLSHVLYFASGNMETN